MYLSTHVHSRGQRMALGLTPPGATHLGFGIWYLSFSWIHRLGWVAWPAIHRFSPISNLSSARTARTCHGAQLLNYGM